MTLELAVRLWLHLLRWTPESRFADPLREMAADVLFPRLGTAPVHAVRRRDLRRMLHEAEAAGVDRADLLYVRDMLIETFDLGVLFGWCPDNPAFGLDLP